MASKSTESIVGDRPCKHETESYDRKIVLAHIIFQVRTYML